METLQDIQISNNQVPHRRACYQSASYKWLLFVTFAVLLLVCGYIIGSAWTKQAALVPSSPQTTNQPKENSSADFSMERYPKKGYETVVNKTDKAGELQAAPKIIASTEDVAPQTDVAFSASPSASITPTQSVVLSKVPKVNNKTQLYSFSLAEKSNISVVFLTCCNRHDMLEEALSTFIEFNEYPFKKLIVVNDGPGNPQVNAIAVKFPNLTMLSTGEKGGQLRAIDEALKLVDTPYVYYSQDDFKLVHSGLITLNIEELEKDQKLLQMWNGWHSKPIYINGTDIVDNNWQWGGFSFQPSVWRMSDYFLIKGGFAKFTKDESLGTGAGGTELIILNEYRNRGFFVRKTAIDFVFHLGADRGLPRQRR